MNSGFINKQCECIVAKWNPELLHKIFIVKHESEIAKELLLYYNKNVEMTILYVLIKGFFVFFFFIISLFFTVNWEFQVTNDKKLRIFLVSYVE